MTEPLYSLPADLARDIEGYAGDVARFLAGEMPAGILKAKRVPRGVYEQRQDGTYMVRVRVAAGRLDAHHAVALAELADEFGDGRLHVTTRQDVQLHGVAIEDTPDIMRRLLQAGLTSKGGGGNTVRNVAACPYAGVCPCEPFDVTPFAGEVTGYLVGLVGSYNLPRKYKIAFSGCSADCAIARANDLGFVAEVRGGQHGFRVFAGGGMGAHSRTGDLLLDWVPAADVVRVAETVRRLFDRLGDRRNRQRARLRFVFEKIGAEAFLQQFNDELEKVHNDGVPACRAAPPIHDSSGLAPPGDYVREVRHGLRVVRQRGDGLLCVELHLPLGFVTGGDFRLLGELAQRFSPERGLRTTRAQNIMLRSVNDADIPALSLALKDLTVNVSAGSPLERFVACAGASTCRLGLCLSRGAAEACADELARRNISDDALQELDINISGCPNACGHHPVAAAGFFGAARRHDGRLVPSYRVVLAARRDRTGGRLARTVGTVPARALPAFLGDLASDFAAGRTQGETFADWFDRSDPQHFGDMVEHHSTVPAYDDNVDFYRDWGCDEDFSLAGRGAGECGAGVFEVVNEDLALARKTLDSADGAAGVFDVLLPTVRALLITRGVDTQEPDGIIRAFLDNFVDTGLINDSFRDLLSRALDHLQGSADALSDRLDETESLLERVELLFSTMDAGLQFHPPETDGPGAAPALSADARTLDLRGVACPMNFVKAKLKLEAMDLGETLKIVLDEGEPVQNVPASLRNEGQEILAMSDMFDGHWQIVVRKNN